MAEEEIYAQKGTKAWRMIDAGVYLLLVIMIALSIRCYFFEPLRVAGSSMVPTLLHNEYMFVEKVSYWFDMPERGDIIICYYPGYKESCVKRVIGLPGEYVSVSGGRILINGNPLDESEYWNDEIYDDFSGYLLEKKDMVLKKYLDNQLLLNKQYLSGIEAGKGQSLKATIDEIETALDLYK